MTTTDPINSPTPEEKLAYQHFVHPPAAAVQAFAHMAQQLYGTIGISSGSAAIDAIVIPTRAGQMRTWVGAPGQGKSTMLRLIAVTEARRLQQVEDKQRYVAFISYEEAVETQELHMIGNRSWTNEEYWRGQVTLDQVLEAGKARAQLPVWWFGESMMRTGIDSPAMTINRAMDGIRYVARKFDLWPSVIVIDYVQAVKVDDRLWSARTAQVIQAIADIVDMGIQLKCPIELGAQALRTSLDRNPPIPLAQDIEYSNIVLQKSSTVLGLWRPWTTNRDDLFVPVGKHEYDNDPNLTVTKTLKHRPGMIGRTIPFLLDPDTLTVVDLDRPRPARNGAAEDIPF